MTHAIIISRVVYMNDKLTLLLNQIHLNKDEFSYFENGKLDKIVCNRSKTKYMFCLDLDNVLPKNIYYDFLNRIKNCFHQAEYVGAKINVNNFDLDSLTDYYRYLIEEYSKEAPLLSIFLENKLQNSLQKSYAEKLIKSNYYTNIMKFLDNNKLIKYLDKKDLFIELKLHPNFFDMYKGTINFDSDRISLSENKIDLTEYKIFITDFSSFVFDYAYLNRPILYFVPDYLEFKSGMNRYRELDLPFEEAFGPLTVESEQAVDELIKICERNFIPEPIYRKRMQEFYLPVKDPCGQLYEYLRKESVNI